jgi:hypothetical protein
MDSAMSGSRLARILHVSLHYRGSDYILEA